MNNSKIGWIGLGKMGIPMSGQLLKAGFSITVFNRSKEKEQDLKALGAGIADTPADLIQQTDLIIIMVSDDKAIDAIFKGDQGILSAGAINKIIINMSTVSPAISREIADLCKKQGNYYLDAPVSGSVKQAEEGQLVIMVGGDDEIFHNAKPVLEKLGKLTLRVGENGAGNTAKLAVNTLLAFHAQGLAEAIVFANKNGISTDDLLTIVNNSALGNVFGKIKGEAIMNDNYQPAFALKHIAKDLRLAKAEGLDTPLGKTVFQTFQEAESAFGEQDIISVIKQIR
ncbi:NAD(P)-dependent oxidoreductase [Dyadobacter sp. CY356]|uniref:NAD(P)-dependent oxidoreductase n=1 Tax=Dyadobacter sp. CY356 TaxID=2906442 RepID=UPI001F2DA7E3|nr:NAD(P)-dependent oxidoreductase [Dyadobacter sp. CY356]MCF0058532.1 NAD(P)-dependent oxidoreductase [Dyadobacter sp. CY356]